MLICDKVYLEVNINDPGQKGIQRGKYILRRVDGVTISGSLRGGETFNRMVGFMKNDVTRY